MMATLKPRPAGYVQDQVSGEAVAGHAGVDEMGSTERADNLSLEELETLLLEKRRRLTELKVGRFVAGESEPSSERFSADFVDEASIAPSPEHWRGSRGRDRRFRSLTLASIDGREPRPRALFGAMKGRATVVGPGGRHSAGGSLARTGTIGFRRRRWQDVLLLVFEVTALIGLLAIVWSSYARLQDLNRQVREAEHLDAMPTALAEPPASPTTAPESLVPGASRTQETIPVPPRARALVTSSVPMAEVPTPGPQSPRRLVIDAIGVDAPIVAGDTWEDLKKGIGHHAESVNPGEPGNVILSAHNDVYGELFRDLHELEPGDEVLVYADQGAFRYVVNKVDIVLPTRIDVMDPTDYPVLTMITCYPYLLDTHRVVVVAELAE